MKCSGFSLQRISAPLQWLRVYRLYRRAFPRNERKPFRMILSMWRRGKTDVWYARSGRRFAGFASTINAEGLILLDYLAVAEALRGRRIGSGMLHALKESYGGRGVFVEIESAFEPGPGRSERIRRRQFYLRNGMQPMQVMAGVFGVKMELLGWNCRVDFPAYRAFYRDNYSAWAAGHITEEKYPQDTNENFE